MSMLCLNPLACVSLLLVQTMGITPENGFATQEVYGFHPSMCLRTTLVGDQRSIRLALIFWFSKVGCTYYILWTVLRLKWSMPGTLGNHTGSRCLEHIYLSTCTLPPPSTLFLRCVHIKCYDFLTYIHTYTCMHAYVYAFQCG